MLGKKKRKIIYFTFNVEVKFIKYNFIYNFNSNRKYIADPEYVEFFKIKVVKCFRGK